MTSAELARLVATAERAAAAAQHAFVGTEHLLAAILADPQSPAARALSAQGVSLDGLAEELLSGLPRADAPGTAPPPLSRFAERAVADAEKAGGDLLAVLLRAPRGRIASVLTRRGAKLDELRKAFSQVSPTAPKTSARTKIPQRPSAPSESATQKTSASSAFSAKSASEKTKSPSAASEKTRAPRRLPPHLEKPGKRGPRKVPWSLILLVAVPLSVVLNYLHVSPLWIFLTACVGVLPLAGLMGEATEQLAERTGPTIGGLLNATFGNAAELIIALVALRAGLLELVKASITGSILGNLLLILGLALIAGGTKQPMLRFSRTSAGMAAAMLALAVAGLVFPAVFHGLHPGAAAQTLAITELKLSEAVAIVLAVTYGFSLLFSLHTHKTLFGVDPAATPEGAHWSVLKSVLVLALATGGVVIESELLVHSVESVTQSLGLSQTFLGLIIIPVIGNAAEHATAITVARKGKLDLSMQIALGSSTQVALLVAPLLIFAGVLFGQPLTLLFTPLEVIALAISTIVVSIITLDGESHWFEGVQLLALYVMIGAAAYFL